MNRGPIVFGFAVALGLLAWLPVESRGAEPQPWISLFDDKDLKGWDTYLGPPYDVAKKDFSGEPLGLNADPNKVFSVVEVDGSKAIRISGAAFGGLSTVREYDDYQLELQFKWGEARHVPRSDTKRDSGVLYHAVAPHGADWFFWMRSFEMQIQEGDCGEFWGLANAIADISAAKNEKGDFVFSPSAPALTFSHASPLGRRVQKAPGSGPEKPLGEWNSLALYTVGNTSVHVVNSVVTMVVKNPRQVVDGKEVPLDRGKIQLQSEGAEVFYRHIRLRPISELPRGLLDGATQGAPAKAGAKP